MTETIELDRVRVDQNRSEWRYELTATWRGKRWQGYGNLECQIVRAMHEAGLPDDTPVIVRRRGMVIWPERPLSAWLRLAGVKGYAKNAQPDNLRKARAPLPEAGFTGRSAPAAGVGATKVASGAKSGGAR